MQGIGKKDEPICKKNAMKLTSRFTQSRTCDRLGRFHFTYYSGFPTAFRSTDIGTEATASQVQGNACKPRLCGRPGCSISLYRRAWGDVDAANRGVRSAACKCRGFALVSARVDCASECEEGLRSGCLTVPCGRGNFSVHSSLLLSLWWWKYLLIFPFRHFLPQAHHLLPILFCC
jgi:hypothetical protein